MHKSQSTQNLLYLAPTCKYVPIFFINVRETFKESKLKDKMRDFSHNFSDFWYTLIKRLTSCKILIVKTYN